MRLRDHCVSVEATTYAFVVRAKAEQKLWPFGEVAAEGIKPTLQHRNQNFSTSGRPPTTSRENAGTSESLMPVPMPMFPGDPWQEKTMFFNRPPGADRATIKIHWAISTAVLVAGTSPVFHI